ncbi:MAG: putative nucleotide-diphospho-sugar transferase, partial [Halobacteriaceae archaeon]
MTDTNLSQGILYIATGEEYIDQARQSAESVQQYMDVPIALVTDRPLETEIFDCIIEVDDPDHSFIDKPKYIDKTPFDKTIYLDTDISILDDISELFEMLNQCDIAVSVDPYEAELRLNQQKEFTRDENQSFTDVPISVPIYQTGVIVFSDNDRTKALFERWLEIHQSNNIESDQTSFRPALYRS